MVASLYFQRAFIVLQKRCPQSSLRGGGAPALPPRVFPSTEHCILSAEILFDPSVQKRRTAEQAALAVVHRHFRPEFLNRLDEVVVFDALTPLQLREIARLQVR